MSNKSSEMMKQAALALKQAADSIDQLEKQNSGLVLENETLKLQLMAADRAAMAKKLAEDMYKKGLLPFDDIPKKIKDIIKMDDSSFLTLRETVDKAPQKSGDSAVIGLDQTEKVASSKPENSVERAARVIAELPL